MKIIIPMSGLGKRFKDVFYVLPKPLIKVNGKHIIEHVVAMFPGNHDFIFICNKEHLATTSLRQVLKTLVPDSIIIPVDTHDKGPVYATTFALPYIHDDDEVLVSYCDYVMKFDIEEMRACVANHGYVGAVPSYTGFHPHLLRKQLYGGVLVNNDGVMLDYKEKYSFTEDPIDSYHSAGAYYFREGKVFKEYSERLLQSDIAIGGEKYTSMLYYLVLQDGGKVYVPTVKQFMQWGTPEDLEEFESWVRYFAEKDLIEKGETSIPKERESMVRIPYDEKSNDFKKTHDYWEEYCNAL